MLCVLAAGGCEWRGKKIKLVGDPPMPPFRRGPGRLYWASSTPPTLPKAAPPRQVVPPVPPPIPGTPRSWHPPYWSKRWKYIVIHHSGIPDRGSWKTIDNGHRGKGWDELGYHFVIGNGVGNSVGHFQADGEVHVGSRWPKQKHGAHCKVGAHNNSINESGIGICLIGNFNKGVPSRKQLQSLVKLTRFLADECGITIGDIRRHRDFKSTDCPGHSFPWAEFRRSLSDVLARGP